MLGRRGLVCSGPVGDRRALFGLPFIAAGAYGSVGRLVHRRWQRRQIVYVLTSERILTVYRSRLVCRFYHTLRYLEKRENGDGSGTILFDKRPVDWHDFHFAFFYELIREREYEYAAIDDVDAVWAIVEAQRRRWMNLMANDKTRPADSCCSVCRRVRYFRLW